MSSEDAVGALVTDLRLLIRSGLHAAFANLPAIRSMRTYQRNVAEDTKVQGAPTIRRILERALRDWDNTASPSSSPSPSARRDAMAALLAFGREGKRNRKLNGVDGLRHKAGQAFEVGYDQFAKAYEASVITDFAEWLVVWDRDHVEPDVRPRSGRPKVGWDEIEWICGRISRQLGRVFQPDVVLTMSGPGSIAAFYCMKLSSEDAPVVTAVTFPRQSPPSREERHFQRIADRAGWAEIETTKWRVFLPNVLRCLDEGERVVLLDDRVISGTTQREVKAHLEAQGLTVFCCALFAPEARRDQLDFIGRVIDGDFEMPWGDQRGRR
jgi:hypothetical protein